MPSSPPRKSVPPVTQGAEAQMFGSISELSGNLFKATGAIKFVDQGSRKQRAAWNGQKSVLPQGN